MEIKYFTKHCTQIPEHVSVIGQVSGVLLNINFPYYSADYSRADTQESYQTCFEKATI